MLDIIRKKKRSWIILVLLGVGVLAFIMVGAYPQGDQETAITIAKVNGDGITSTELDKHYQRLLKTYQQILPGDLGNLNLRSEMLHELINSKLLLQEATRLGLHATDKELANTIKSLVFKH